MANKYKGTSYDTLKSYLDSIDVDTSNMDNDTLDYQYLQRLRKRNGEALSTQEQREGGITLKQYLADADAERVKNEGIALAENNARQETAYNDYVNSKLAKYLNIAEENNGTAGYTGITEGNRIALANQEKNIASNIQSEKQNAISDYLKQYNNTLASNSQYALDQMTEMQSTFDKEAKDQADTDKYNLESDIKSIINKKQPNENINGDDYYDVNVLNEIKDYINNYNVDDATKQELIKRVESSYNWKDYKIDKIKNINSSIETIINKYNATDENGKKYYSNDTLTEIDKVIDNSDLDDQSKQQLKDEIRTKYNFKDIKPQSKAPTLTASNGKTLDKVSNVASRVFSFYDEGGKYDIRSSDSTGYGMEAYPEYKNKVSKTKNGEFYKFTQANGTQVILYRRDNPSASNTQSTTQFVIFKKNSSWNTATNGFDKLWDKAIDLDTL